MVAEVFNADTAAEFLEGMAEVMECFKFAKSAILRHFKPKPLTQVWMLVQQIHEFVPELPVNDRFNREIDREFSGKRRFKDSRA